MYNDDMTTTKGHDMKTKFNWKSSHDPEHGCTTYSLDSAVDLYHAIEYVVTTWGDEAQAQIVQHIPATYSEPPDYDIVFQEDYPSVEMALDVLERFELIELGEDPEG